MKKRNIDNYYLLCFLNNLFFVSKSHFILQKMPRKSKNFSDRKMKEQKNIMKERRSHQRAKSNTSLNCSFESNTSINCPVESNTSSNCPDESNTFINCSKESDTSINCSKGSNNSKNCLEGNTSLKCPKLIEKQK